MNAVARQNTLMISNMFNFPTNIYRGGIDSNKLIASHYVEGEDGEKIYATPWDYAPGDEADAKFRREVAECQAKMEHLATHTPRCFLSSKRKRSHDDGEGGDVDKRTNTGVLLLFIHNKLSANPQKIGRARGSGNTKGPGRTKKGGQQKGKKQKKSSKS